MINIFIELFNWNQERLQIFAIIPLLCIFTLSLGDDTSKSNHDKSNLLDDKEATKQCAGNSQHE